MEHYEEQKVVRQHVRVKVTCDICGGNASVYDKNPVPFASVEYFSSEYANYPMETYRFHNPSYDLCPICIKVLVDTMIEKQTYHRDRGDLTKYAAPDVVKSAPHLRALLDPISDD